MLAKTAVADHYQVLGVARDATPEQINRAWRGLARRFHPDLNPGDPHAADRTKHINRAYQCLSEPKQRAMYDENLRGHPSETGQRDQSQAQQQFDDIDEIIRIAQTLVDRGLRKRPAARALFRVGLVFASSFLKAARQAQAR